MASGAASGVGAAGGAGGAASGGSRGGASGGGAGGSNSGAENASRVQTNPLGSRADIGWKHGVAVNGDKKFIKCKYCEKVNSGGIYRFKHHLAGTQKDVGACKSVPDEVRKEMWELVTRLQKNLIKKTDQYVEALIDEEEESEKRKREEVVEKNPGDIFKKRGISNQTTIISIFKRNVREEACTKISRFLYNNAISFNVVKSEEFSEMCAEIARHGIGFKPPLYHEVRVKYLKQEVEATKEALVQHRAGWKKTGCSIMTDGWTNKRRRTILNFLVNSPMGTIFLKFIDAAHISKTVDKNFRMIDEVVEEIGEEHVIQVVTENAANYKEVGDVDAKEEGVVLDTLCSSLH